ncbi:MAG: flagellar biosynthesis anti-sigma factor FlgM, partial [Thermoguttaceae bacterium]
FPTDSGRTTSSQPTDEIKFSAEAQKLSETSAISSSENTSAPRLDLINKIRAEIAAGTYETPEKLDIALNRMTNSF